MRATALILAVLFIIGAPVSTQAVESSNKDIDVSQDIGNQKYFAITLRSSFTPISDKQAKRDYPEQPVYLLQSKAFGKNVYHLRLGFFENFADAMTYRDTVLAKYPAAWVTEIPSNEYNVIVRSFPNFKMAAPKSSAPAKVEPEKVAPAIPVPTPAPTPAAPTKAAPTIPTPTPQPTAPMVAGAFSPKALYAIQLDESTKAAPSVRADLPESLKKYRLYTATSRDKNITRFQLKLGFFEKEEEVYAARKQLKSIYPNSKVTRITLGEQKDSVRTALSAPAAVVPPVAVAPQPTPAPAKPTPKATGPAVAPEFLPSVSATGPASSYDVEALALIDKSRAALAQGDNKTAISLLDKLLRLPPNRYSQDAQEYIGLARQRSGDVKSAKDEYQLYLRLYPTGESADRVRQRLAVLEPSKTAVAAPTLRIVKPKTEAQSSIVGNLSQFYFHGASKVDTTTLAPGTNQQTQAGLTQTDQSALVTNLNLTHRYRSERYDNRFVLRDTYTRNFLLGQENTNRPSSIYYELKDRKLDYSARVGRQPGGTAGVLGRFDGLTAGYNFNSKWKLNAAAGIPTDISYDSRLKFRGFGMDLGPFADHWGGSIYTIQQKVDDVIDRNAVGGELRFFSPSFTAYGLYDYDTEFQDSNITMLQSNWTSAGGTALHMLYDRRKTPSLELVNALIGESDTSIKSQLQTKSYEQLKQQAKNQTATTDARNIGVTQTLSTHWQVGLDASTSHTTSTAGTPTSPGLPDTGLTHTYSANIIGTGLFSPRDVSVFTYSRTNSPTSTGNLYALTNRMLWGASWELETSLSWYTFHDTASDTDSRRFSPTLRPKYKWKDNITLEAELGQERTDTKSPTSTDKNIRRYWSLGYRWDF